MLSQFTMSDALAAELTALAAAGWSQLSLQELAWSEVAPVTTPLPPLRVCAFGSFQYMDDSLLAQLQQCSTSIGMLVVEGTKLQDQRPGDSVVPWATIKLLNTVRTGGLVMELPLPDWLRQVHLLGKTRWDLGFLTVMLRADQVRDDGTSQTSRVPCHDARGSPGNANGRQKGQLYSLDEFTCTHVHAYGSTRPWYGSTCVWHGACAPTCVDTQVESAYLTIAEMLQHLLQTESILPLKFVKIACPKDRHHMPNTYLGAPAPKDEPAHLRASLHVARVLPAPTQVVLMNYIWTEAMVSTAFCTTAIRHM